MPITMTQHRFIRLKGTWVIMIPSRDLHNPMNKAYACYGFDRHGTLYFEEPNGTVPYDIMMLYKQRIRQILRRKEPVR